MKFIFWVFLLNDYNFNNKNKYTSTQYDYDLKCLKILLLIQYIL